jgi:hypothetical protein
LRRGCPVAIILRGWYGALPPRANHPYIDSGVMPQTSAPPASRVAKGPVRHVPLPVLIGPHLDRKPPAERGRFSLTSQRVLSRGSL